MLHPLDALVDASIALAFQGLRRLGVFRHPTDKLQDVDAVGLIVLGEADAFLGNQGQLLLLDFREGLLLVLKRVPPRLREYQVLF
jgi:hypothetical protein